MAPGRILPILLLLSTGPAALGGAADGGFVLEPLRWAGGFGVEWHSPWGTVWVDGNERSSLITLRFPSEHRELRLGDPAVTRVSDTHLRVVHRVAAPGGATLEVTRDISVDVYDPPGGDACAATLLETLTLSPSEPLRVDLEIERPIAVLARVAPSDLRLTYPLQNGWAKTTALMPQPARSEYRLGHALGGAEALPLALPLVAAGVQEAWSCSLFTDPGFGSLFELRQAKDGINGSIRYRYAGSRVPLRGTETRAFGVRITLLPLSEKSFGAALDAFFRLMLADVPPGPAWLHDIAMVGYDYLSDNGQGWERDIQALSQWLKPEERRRVALCLHGWYDAIGSYCYDASARAMKKEWVAFGPTRKIRLTEEDLKRRLRLAKEQGFRVLLYFADGLASDSACPSYRDDWAYRDAKGNKIKGWQGPDTFGPTYWLNPAHPQVSQWFLDYMDALLRTYGAQVDGFVWDETFECRVGQIATQPEPAYCDRAMMALVKELTRRVHALDPQKVFLASDCIGAVGGDSPGYAMVADGTYQDTGCSRAAWPFGLFPNWRNALWSCNWHCVSRFEDTRWGVENFGVPVAISNGWGDDRGPSEWTPAQRDAILKLFRERLQRKERVRFLTTDPAGLLATSAQAAQGDPLPPAFPGETNWALAANGGRATASSEYVGGGARYPASGAIDGIRDTRGWGAGHGWASAAGEPLPQWLAVDFGQPRTVARVVVISYHEERNLETAAKWGARGYLIQAWDAKTSQWRTLLTDERGLAVNVRVHRLPEAVRTERIRIVVTRVAAADGLARLLQLEAWGP